MRNILFFVIVLASLQAPAQAVTLHQLDSAFNTLDSFKVRTATTTTNTYITADTLAIPVNSIAVAKVDFLYDNPATGEMGYTYREIYFKNIGGKYSVLSSTYTSPISGNNMYLCNSYLGYIGVTGVGPVCVRVVGPLNTVITWSIRETLFIKNL